MLFLSEKLIRAAAILKSRGIETYKLDSEIIVSHVLKIPRYRLFTGDPLLSGPDAMEIDSLLSRRCAYEPVAYLTGEKEFYSLIFKVDRRVLIPRPETELLVDLALFYSPPGARLLDLCTGSGAIAAAVKHNRPDIKVSASDISPDALAVAMENCGFINGPDAVDFFQGHLFEPFTGRGESFDLIVTNPPYVDPAVSDTLQRDIFFEPAAALFAGKSGKALLEEIIMNFGPFLREEGALILEIASDMKDFVLECASLNGYKVQIMNDYSGRARAAVLRR